MEVNASEQIDEMVAKLTDWRGATLANFRRIIREADTELVEDMKWRGAPVWSHDGIVCLAAPFKDKVKITFPHGAHLADPDKLFNNGLEGNEWRAIDIFKDDKINENSLKTLIIAAVEYNHSIVKVAPKPRATQRDAKKKSAK